MTKRITRVSFMPIMDVYDDGDVTIDFSSSLLNFYDEYGEEILVDEDTPEWAENTLNKVSTFVDNAIRNGEF